MSGSPDRPYRQRMRRLVALAAAAIALCGPLAACDTPVYRFAMYSRRWAPWPYYIFYLHTGEEAAQDADVNEKLKKVVKERREHVNLEFKSVRTDDADQFRELPPSVQRLWQAHKDKSAPVHVILSPASLKPGIGDVFTGRLPAGDIEALVDSPARREISGLLAQGRLVLLFLPGKRADRNGDDQNSVAAKTILNVLQKINDGKIDELRPSVEPADSLVPELPAGKDKKRPAEAEARKLRTSLLKVSQDDTAETWLVRMLQRVDTELDGLADQPMAFWVYGRGRAMPPLVGQGITAENLVGDVRLLIGPCTCEIKDQNPGVDLLTTTDWEAAALQMARLFGEEEGNQELDVTSLVPRLDITPAASASAATNSLPQLGERNPPQAAGSAATTSAEPDNSSPPSGSRKMLRYVGIALGCALFLLLAISLPFLRRGKCGG